MLASRLSLLGLQIGAALCLTRMPVYADSTGDAKEAIQAAYQAMDKATSAKNASGYAVYLLPNYVGVDEKGKETNGKAATVQGLSKAFSQLRTATSATRVLSLTLQDGGAVVTTRSSLSFTAIRNGQPFTVTGTNKVRDFWVKSAGHWMLKRERVMSSAQTVNGQPVPAGG